MLIIFLNFCMIIIVFFFYPFFDIWYSFLILNFALPTIDEYLGTKITNKLVHCSLLNCQSI